MLQRALGELAKNAIDQEDFRFRLRETFIRQELDKFDSSLFGIACELGWINKLGSAVENPDEPVYAFLHPTFQEYFAALAIDAWDFFLNHIPENPNHPDANYKLFEPQWREVIILWFGRYGILTSLKEEVLFELLNFQDNCGKFYFFRSYFLAAECIQQFNGYSKIEPEKIISEVINYSFGYFDEQQRKWCRFLKPISQEAKRIIENGLEISKTKKYLLELIDSCSDSGTRWHIANTLDTLGVCNKRIKSILIAGVSSKLKPHIAESFNKLVARIKENQDDNVSPKSSKELLIFENDEELKVFEDNAYREIKFDELIQQIQSSDDWFVVVRVTEYLQRTLEGFQLLEMVKALKPYLLDMQEYLSDELGKMHFRYEYIYEIVWHCAQNMSYPDFYRAWEISPSSDTKLLKE